MSDPSRRLTGFGSRSRFVAGAGVAGLVSAAVGVAIGVLEGSGPAPNAPAAEVLTHILRQPLEIGSGAALRFALQPCLLVFAVGVYEWLGPSAGAWRRLGALGIALVPAAALPANSVAVIALWRLELLQTQPGFAVLLWSMSIVFFFGVLLLWGVGVAATSMAAWITGRLPSWLCVIGAGIGFIGIGSCVAVSVLLPREEVFGPTIGLFSLGLVVWLAGTSLYMLRDYRRAGGDNDRTPGLPGSG